MHTSNAVESNQGSRSRRRRIRKATAHASFGYEAGWEAFGADVATVVAPCTPLTRAAAEMNLTKGQVVGQAVGGLGGAIGGAIVGYHFARTLGGVLGFFVGGPVGGMIGQGLGWFVGGKIVPVCAKAIA